MSQSHAARAGLDVADRIGNRLCRDALWSGGRCNWLGWGFVTQGTAQTPGYRAQGPGLDGLAGIALFLAWLQHFTRDPLQMRTLRGALRQLDRALASATDADTDRFGVTTNVGFHAGSAGIADTCLRIGDLLQDDVWLAHGVRVLERIASEATRPRTLDVATGVAGSIPILLQADARFDLPPLAIAARRQADLLLDAARLTEDGWSWPAPDPQTARPFLGYPHGAGGIACALLEVHRAIGGDHYRDAAIAALRDARRQLPTFDVLGWCDGVAAVASALLRASELLAQTPPSDDGARPHHATAADSGVDLRNGSDLINGAALIDGADAMDSARVMHEAGAVNGVDIAAALEAEAETLLDAMAARLADAAPWAHSFCLYRGLAGCADLLLTAADQLGRPAWRDTAEAIGALGIVHFDRPRVPWPCGLPGVGAAPNLLLGLAGVGYFYLRLHRPRLVPTLLVLREDGHAARPDRDRLRLESLADLVSAPSARDARDARAALPEAP